MFGFSAMQVPEEGAKFFFSAAEFFRRNGRKSFAKRWQHCYHVWFGFSARYRRTDEERVRCFLVKETKRGIQVAQSSSPSCHTDLHSSLAAHRTFKAQPHKILLRLKIWFIFVMGIRLGWEYSWLLFWGFPVTPKAVLQLLVLIDGRLFRFYEGDISHG